MLRAVEDEAYGDYDGEETRLLVRRSERGAERPVSCTCCGVRRRHFGIECRAAPRAVRSAIADPRSGWSFS